MACLFVSSKVEDTIKKLKDIMMATYSYRHPEAADWDPESKVRPKGCHHVFFFFFFFPTNAGCDERAITHCSSRID